MNSHNNIDKKRRPKKEEHDIRINLIQEMTMFIFNGLASENHNHFVKKLHHYTRIILGQHVLKISSVKFTRLVTRPCIISLPIVLSILILDPRLSIRKICNRIRKISRQKEQGRDYQLRLQTGFKVPIHF